MSIGWEAQDLFVSSAGAAVSVADGGVIIDQGCSIKITRSTTAFGLREWLIRKGVGGKIGATVRCMEKGRFAICSVSQRSPAYVAGLRIGDELMSLGETSLRECSLSDLREPLKTNRRNHLRLCTKDRVGERYITLYKDSGKGYGFRFVQGEITFVRPNSSAEQAGLETRHHIVEVNEEVVVGLQDEDIEAIIWSSMGALTLCILPSRFYNNLLCSLYTLGSAKPLDIVEI
ncbi:syntenin-1 [Anopheles darlingi]|uniref:Syntenin-1 n=1 Tax=Anopheles darlingi TaxID=43151 RepID=W5JSI4_ANODA|nr:syntenin-1 [Anopheles darlingi]